MSSPKTDDTGFSSVCVECGKINQQTLYKRYTGGSIQLSQCVSPIVSNGLINDQLGE